MHGTQSTILSWKIMRRTLYEFHIYLFEKYQNYVMLRMYTNKIKIYKLTDSYTNFFELSETSSIIERNLAMDELCDYYKISLSICFQNSNKTMLLMKFVLAPKYLLIYDLYIYSIIDPVYILSKLIL